MEKISAQTLPSAIRRYAEGLNGRDPDLFMTAFAPDALVNDLKREFLGHAAIRAFADADFFGADVTMAVEEAFAHAGTRIVRFRLDGSYDKTGLPDPLILTHYFVLQDGLISQLIILLNSKNAL